MVWCIQNFITILEFLSLIISWKRIFTIVLYWLRIEWRLAGLRNGKKKKYCNGVLLRFPITCREDHLIVKFNHMFVSISYLSRKTYIPIKKKILVGMWSPTVQKHVLLCLVQDCDKYHKNIHFHTHSVSAMVMIFYWPYKILL